MKKNFTLIVLLLILSFSVRGQFQFSVVPEVYMPDTEGASHIHDVTCYSLSEAVFGTDKFDLYISTWWDSETGLYFQRSYRDANNAIVIVDEGVLTIPYVKIHGATILGKVHDTFSNNYTVAVVYSDQNGGYIDFYEWTNAGLSYISTTTLTTQNTISRMSIDGHRQYAYAVVWEENNGEMYSVGGWVNASPLPLVGQAKHILCPVFTSQLGRVPDLAISHNTSNSGIRVNYTYVESDYNTVAVSYLDFDSLFSSTTSFVLNLEDTMGSFINTCPPPFHFKGFRYSFPKIDAPEHNVNYWAMVINDIYNRELNIFPYNITKSSWIRSMHKSSAGIQFVTLNDGSLSGTVNMTDTFYDANILESKPAVAYHIDSDELIHYAWGKTQDHPDLGDHDYIGVMLDPVVNDAIHSNSGDGYRVIDYDPDLETMVRCIALSGQNEKTNEFFIVFSAKDLDTGGENLYYKTINWNTIQDEGYRSPIVNEEEKPVGSKLIANYYPNPVTNSFKIEINEAFEKDYFLVELYNLQGDLLFHQRGFIEDINKSLKLGIKNLISSGNIMLRLHSLSSQISESKTLVKD